MSFGPGDVLRVVLRCTTCEGELSYSMKRYLPNVTKECPLYLQEWSRWCGLKTTKPGC